MVKRNIIFCFLFTHLTLLAQTPAIESLRKKVRDAKPQNKAVLYNEISFEFRAYNGDSVNKYAKLAIQFADNRSQLEQQIIGYRNLGIGYQFLSDFEKSLMYLDTAMSLAKINEFETEIPNIANNIGNVYWKKGDYLNSLKNYYLAKDTWLKLDTKTRLPAAYSNIALSYMWIGEYDSSFLNLIKAEEICLTTNNEFNLTSIYINRGVLRFFLKEYEGAKTMLWKGIRNGRKHSQLGHLAVGFEYMGQVHADVNQLDSAKLHFAHSINLYEQASNPGGKASVNHRIGKVDFKEGNFELAMANFTKAYRVKKQMEEWQDLPEILNDLSRCHLKLDQVSSAYASAIECREIAMNTGSKKDIVAAELLLYEINNSQNNPMAANRHLLSHYMYKDSLISEENLLKISRAEFKDELSQKQDELARLEQTNRQQFSQLEKQRLDIANTRLMVFALIAIVVLYGMASLVWYWYHRRRTKMLEVLTKMNSEIAFQKEKIEEQSKTLEKTNGEIVKMNESLEETIKERTEQIMSQNEKLKSFAYSNAHHVRAALTRILGLTNLFHLHKSKNREIEFITDNITESAKELDKITRDLSSHLDDIVSKN